MSSKGANRHHRDARNVSASRLQFVGHRNQMTRRLVDLAYAALAEFRDDLISAEASPGDDGHGRK